MLQGCWAAPPAGAARPLLTAAAQVYEDEQCIAFLDLFPMTPGHTLLVPKAHYATIMDTPADVAAAVLQRLPAGAKAVAAACEAEGINILQNNNPAAGQVP